MQTPTANGKPVERSIDVSNKMQYDEDNNDYREDKQPGRFIISFSWLANRASLHVV